MLRNLTFNSYIWILLGLGCLIYGGFMGWEFRRAITRMFPLPFGLMLTGSAMIITGLTNGFTVYTPLGRKLTKVGILLFIAGLPLLLYGFWGYL
jgi:hypothetical protein